MKILIIFLILFLFKTQVLVSSMETKQTSTELLIQRYFPENYKTARAVFYAESGLREKVVSKTGDYGISQINCFAHRFQVPSCGWLLNSENNISFARQLYMRSGWGIWVGYTSKAYQKYL